MQREKKYWEGLLNGDDADAFIQFTEYINCKDFRFGLTSDKGFAKQLESVGSTAEIPNSGLPVSIGNENIVLGDAKDEPHRRDVYFNWNNVGDHGIYCYDYLSNTIYTVLLDAQVTGGLNFDKNHLIHSARIENGCVYWTDNFNEPRRINIDAGIKLNHPSYVTSVEPYVAPLSQSVISWIRRQPGLPPVALKQVDNTFPGNYTNMEAFLFSYRYIYREFEYSTLSGKSQIANFGSEGEPNNYISISIPFAEQIDQDVIQIDLVATYLISGISFIINSWKKSIPADATAIANHNAGTAALTYSYYNNVAGNAIDQAYSLKLFDSLPIKANTLEMAKNRAFIGNYTIGYDSANITSLTFTTTTIDFSGGGSTITGEWYLLKYLSFSPHLGNNSYYVLQTTNNFVEYPSGPVQIFGWNSTVPLYPITVNFADLTFLGNTPTEAAQKIASDILHTDFIALISYVDQGHSSVILTTVSPSINMGTVFKANAAYQLSINFKDNAGRESGVVTNSSLIFNTPDTGLSDSTYIRLLTWMLSNINALLEIPEWAYYYSIDITKCLRTRFFVQNKAAMIYATKDADGNYEFTTTAYAVNLAGIAIDLTFLNAYGMGYVLSQGDFVEIYVNSKTLVLPILAQTATYIICQLADAGTLSPSVGMFEIYTPYQRQSNEPFFEIAQIYPVLNPGTSLRQYSTLTGQIGGDVTVLRRDVSGSSYFTEAMSPSDKLYKYWFTNAGRPNFIDDIGQQQKTTSIAYSNTFISGSRNNGLSTFDALDTQDISPDFGAMQKLQLSSKIQKIGSVMLAICSGPATASIYLGENTLISQTGDAVVAQANTVIGSIHELKGGFGTLNPESVIEFRGNIYWFDVQNGKVIQYAENGLFPISNYKLSRFWKLFSDQYKSMTAEEIEALGDRPFIFACADPHHEELLFTVPRTLSAPPEGYLPDYPSTPYPFDIWDGQGKTLVYKLAAQPNRWQGSYSFQPEYMFYLENNLFSFKQGKLYEHNQSSSYCQYYGVQFFPTIMCIDNQQLNKPRTPESCSAEANAVPMQAYFMTRYPYVQATDLLSMDFSNKEGIFYSDILRNKLDPRFNNQFGQALLAGEKLRATAVYMMWQWDATQGIIQVKFTNINFTPSLGQPV